ncbi:hypothetical protein MLD38_002664 [Melastoma candidum]|uniref:Uncharacterized protein n=1 Tax=Melastoma candidum TaxID=119954 RepID=A0ACB9S0A2_9MYRT|nr:hypothetical protein MLD38_002664 [Melastoma candidum]
MEDLFLPDDSPAWLFSIPSFWTPEENKMFERALAVFDEDTPDRWLRVAALIPGKSPRDVQDKYRELLDDVTEIESGRVPIPGYLGAFDDSHRSRKKPSVLGRGAADHERKKGVPWTEEEHRFVSKFFWDPFPKL